jgi:hypothetical protein
MRLDWLQKTQEYGRLLIYRNGWSFIDSRKTVRQAIDAEIKRARRGKL